MEYYQWCISSVGSDLEVYTSPDMGNLCGAMSCFLTHQKLFKNPVDISGAVICDSPDYLLLSGTVVGGNLDHVRWEDTTKSSKTWVYYSNSITCNSGIISTPPL